jgi:signal recognition particle subunit SRP54
MFKILQTKLDSAFASIRGKTRITEKDLETTLRDVRMALLEADVNFKVVKDFCAQIAEKAKGEEVMKSLSPGQQVIKIVHEELINVVGVGSTELNLVGAPPVSIMVVGLQGSGKTTSCAKLALLLRREKKKKCLLVPADVYRPAAILQLQKLGAELGVEVFPSTTEQNPVDIATRAVEYARNHLLDVVIIDTAGRMQIDGELMKELSLISDAIKPQEVLLVADAMTGQEAVNVAKGFNDTINIDGIILTKLDGDARGGAALSMRAVIQKPIKFVGVSEKPDGLEVFHPERFAQRVLGMGDVLSLIEKAQKEITEEDSLKLQKKFKKNEFNLQDFLEQYRKIQRMGSMESLLGMIPGMDKLGEKVNFSNAEKEGKRVEAIILSMTTKERENPSILDGSRRKRIANGSGTTVQEVNSLLNQFLEMKKMMQKIAKGGIGALLGPMMGGMGGKMMGGMGNAMKGKKRSPFAR